MNLEAIYRQGIEQKKTDRHLAKTTFEQVVSALSSKSLTQLSVQELRMYAFSQQNIFQCSDLSDYDAAEKAITAFELYFKLYSNSCKDDIESYESYLVTLELTWQYEKLFTVSKQLLACGGEARETALEWLSFVDGPQSWEDMISYRRELISITADENKRARLEKELEDLLEYRENITKPEE